MNGHVGQRLGATQVSNTQGRGTREAINKIGCLSGNPDSIPGYIGRVGEEDEHAGKERHV